jgi:hypothetical protein
MDYEALQKSYQAELAHYGRLMIEAEKMNAAIAACRTRLVELDKSLKASVDVKNAQEATHE